MKVLGTTITNKGSLVSHYKNTKQELQTNLNLYLKHNIKHKFGGSHPGTNLNIYKSLI